MVGITSGHKYTGNKATPDDFSIRFLVGRKVEHHKCKRRLPRFLYGRTAKGKVDRSLRFATDVVALGKVRASCGAGSFLQCTPGGRGTASLIFRDKSVPSAGFFLVSCAHVLSRFSGGQKVIASSECCSDSLFASLVFASKPNQDRLPFDVGLAKLSPQCVPQPDGTVVGDLGLPAVQLSGIAPPELVAPKHSVSCRMRVSHNTRGVIADHPTGGEIDIEYDEAGMTLTVENVCLLEVDKCVLPGDSGGLIFTQDGQALGIVIASSDAGWAIFHPFGSAFQYLADNTNRTYKPF